MSNLCRIVLIILTSLCACEMYAHASFIEHGEDIMAVFGFEPDTRLFNRSKDTRSNTSWVKLISSDMIDSKEFHKKLEKEYPGFRISHPNYHRLLFHWGYYEDPWSSYLERHIKTYCTLSNANQLLTIKQIKKEIKIEWERRKQTIIRETEKVFGFAHGGRDRINSECFISIACYIHLLGDRQSDNSVFVGVANINTIAQGLMKSLNNLDPTISSPINEQISNILNKNPEDFSKTADILMEYLKEEVPGFIKNAQKGGIYSRLCNNGFEVKYKRWFW